MATYPGVSSYVQITPEATEGTSQVGASGVTSYGVVGRGDDLCTLRKQKLAAVLPSNAGQGRVWRVVHPMDEVAGRLNTWLFPTTGVAPWLDWALGLAGTPLDLTSYTVDKYTPNRDFERFTGVKVESLEIAAAADSPDAQPVALAYELRGMDMTDPSGESLAAPSYTAEDPYVFSRGTFTLAGSADATVRAFAIEVGNTLAQGRCTGTTVRYHQFAGREIRARFTIDYDDLTLVGHHEAGTHVACRLDFTHPNGASADLQLNLQTDCAILSVTPAEPLDDVTTLEVELLATMVGSDDVTYSIS